MLPKLFLISLLLLIVSLLVSIFSNRKKRLVDILTILFSITTSLLLCIVLLNRFYANQFAFLQPSYLVLLILPITIFITRIFWSTAFEPTLSYPSTQDLIPSFSVSTFFTRWLGLLCGVLALALLIVALSRPVTVNRSQLPPTQGVDIMMILDASASMNKNDFFPTRFVAAQKNAIRFIGKRFNDRIGLTIFAKNATLAAPLTLDHEAVQDLIASLYLGIVNPDATAIGDALGVASNHLKNSTAKSKIIVLLTDGSNNAGAVDPLLAAKAAAAYGIKVYAIGTASPPQESIFSSEEDEIDEGLLMSIANETGGAFYRAKNEQELQEIYNKINALEKTDFVQTAKISHYDAYRPFLLAALLLLLVFCLSKLFFIRIP